MSSLDFFKVAILVGASSFGTILGAIGAYWLIKSEFKTRLQASLITFMVLLTGTILIKLNNKKSPNPLNRFKSKEIKATSKLQASGLHRLESKFMEKSDEISEPFLEAVKERNKILGLNQLNDNNLKEEFYKAIYGKCCESVIGNVWIPVGVVGPLPLVSKSSKVRNVLVPLATVEGALVASVNRGCKVLRKCFELNPSNLSSIISNEARKGITRGPSFRANTIENAAAFLKALQDPIRFQEWADIFNSSSPGGHVKLQEIRGRQLGNFVYLRIRSDTSEAMGMNMISRGCQVLFENILKRAEFKNVKIESLSGNFCVDKKPAAMNWIEGRGHEVISSVRIPRHIIKEVFGIDDPESLEKLNISKNIIGSAAAGSIGGFNAQVANVVASVYLSTGQDMAQVVDASQAMTLIEFDKETDEIIASLTMPCVEIGIRGGGTSLPHQNHYLKMILGDSEYSNGPELVDEFAKCIGLVALAGELSLLASLKTGTLVSSHFRLNH